MRTVGISSLKCSTQHEIKTLLWTFIYVHRDFSDGVFSILSTPLVNKLGKLSKSLFILWNNLS